MENQTVQNPIPIPESVVPVVPTLEPKAKFPITYLFLSLLTLLFLTSTAFLYYQNMQLKNMLASYQTPTASSAPTATTDPMVNWKTYTNKVRNYSISYPSDWTIDISKAETNLDDVSGAELKI